MARGPMQLHRLKAGIGCFTVWLFFSNPHSVICIEFLVQFIIAVNCLIPQGFEEPCILVNHL